MTTNLAPAYAACGALLTARPDLPLLMHEAVGWSATDACDQDRPFVILSPQKRGVEIYARPRGGVAAKDVGFTFFVRYPLYDARMIGDDLADRGFEAELRTAVEAKCAELRVASPIPPVAERGCDECSSEPGEVHGGGCLAVAARGAR